MRNATGHFAGMEVADLPEIDNETLVVRAQGGDRKARQMVLAGNQRLIMRVAVANARRGIDPKDLVNEGVLGMDRAIDRFDVNMGLKFISFAIWHIRQAINSAIEKKTHLVRLPANRNAEWKEINDHQRTLEQEWGRDVSVWEAGNDLVEQGKLVSFVEQHHAVFVEDFIYEDSGDRGSMDAFVSVTEDPTDAIFAEEAGEILERLMKPLSVREKDVVCRYHGLQGYAPETLSQLGDRYGLTRERVRQIKQKALERIQKRALHEHGVL